MTDATHPHRRPAGSLETTLEAMRQRIAENLSIDPARLRMHDPGGQSVIGVTGERWQIFYGDQWQDLPWYFVGPLGVDRALVRKWLDGPKGGGSQIADFAGAAPTPGVFVRQVFFFRFNRSGLMNVAADRSKLKEM